MTHPKLKLQVLCTHMYAYIWYMYMNLSYRKCDKEISEAGSDILGRLAQSWIRVLWKSLKYPELFKIK